MVELPWLNSTEILTHLVGLSDSRKLRWNQMPSGINAASPGLGNRLLGQSLFLWIIEVGLSHLLPDLWEIWENFSLFASRGKSEFVSVKEAFCLSLQVKKAKVK